MKIKCYLKGCENHCLYDDSCTADEIEIDENGCETYIGHTEVAKEYQEPFFKQMKSIKDGHECKQLCHGKRLTRFGLTFFTQDDDRYGDEDVHVTEEVTGYYCGELSKLTEERCNEIKEKMKDIIPVKERPDGNWWEDW